MTAALEGCEWSAAHRPYFTPGKDPVPIVQEAGWAPGPVWTGGKSRPPPGFDTQRIRIYTVFKTEKPKTESD